MSFPSSPIPRVRTGPAGLRNVLNVIIDAINRTRTITGDGQNIAVKEVGNNLVVSLVGNQSRIIAQRFVVKSIETDRLICRKMFHDESEDDVDVVVAKPFGARDAIGDGGFEVDQVVLAVIASGGTGIQDGEAWVEWIVLGGSGSPVVRMRIKSITFTHLVCRTWNGTTEGDADILVARPPELRGELAYWQIIYPSITSMAFSFSAQRVVVQATGESTEIWHITPDYAVDAEIWAAVVNSTGVTVDGNELRWLDVTGVRKWAVE